MPYKVTVWCSSCISEDYNGCFDGGTEDTITDPDTNGPILTQERAEQIGWNITRSCGSWDYEVSEIATESTDD